MVTRTIIGALLVSTSGWVLPVQAQQFCSDERKRHHLELQRQTNLVVNSDAMLDTTSTTPVSAVEMRPEPLFSFKHTIGAILESAQVPNTATSREAFVQTMLDTFSPTDTVALNRKAGVLVPIDRPFREASGSTRRVCGRERHQPERDRHAPLGVVQPLRFGACQLEPLRRASDRLWEGKSWLSSARFLLIFEAAVPNPDPAAGEAGCRPVTEFWAGLSGSSAGSDTEIAKKLHAFFYEGKTDPALPGPICWGRWSIFGTTAATATAARCAAICSCSSPGNCASG